MSPSQRPLSLECFRVDKSVNVGAGVIAFLLLRGILAMVSLEESEGAPLPTSPAELIDRAVDLVVAASLETLATPPVRLAGPQPEAVFQPMVGGSTSPTIAILLWAVKGEMVVRIAPKANLPSLVLLRLLFLGLFSFLFCFQLLLRRPLFLGQGRSVTFGLVL